MAMQRMQEELKQKEAHPINQAHSINQGGLSI